MKAFLKILVICFLILFSGRMNAQTTGCKTYACMLCIWGGELKIEIPTIFSPNNDFINDVWVPKVQNELCIGDYNIKVFNRWGKLLFETSVYSTGWNGNEVIDGRACPAGTYFYMLSYTNAYAKEAKTEKGFFELVR